MTSASPLSGVRVLELAREIPAAYCARQLGAWGADVAVVELGAASPLRDHPPFADARGGRATSLLWEWIAANKRAVRLDSDGQLHGLMAAADILVTDLEPAALERLGVSPAYPSDAPSSLCVISITPFGLSGPYGGFRGADIVVEALSGYLSLNGRREREPLRSPGHLTAYVVGVNAFIAALAAWLKRERTGHAERVEISAMETVASMVPFLQVQYSGREKTREGGTESGVRLLPCNDGWLSVAVNAPASKDILMEILEIPTEALPTDLYDGALADVIRRTTAFFGDYTRGRSSEDLFLAFTVSGLTCGKAMTLAELLDLDPLAERGFFRDSDNPRLGRLRFPGPPALLQETGPAPITPAPTSGVAPEALGWAPRASAIPAGPVNREAPLKGVRVLDLTQAWIGPFATLLLADLGAEVLKIESHRRPDIWRTLPTPAPALDAHRAAAPNRCWTFNSVNLNKRGLALDLRSPEGKAIFLDLVRNADVVAENFTPTVMDNFGLGYPVLRAAREDIVMLSSSGFGKTGLWSLFKTNGSAIEALAGWDSLHAYPDGEPVLMGFYQADAIDAFQMAAMVLVGLVHRLRTGRGEAIDAAMLDASVGYFGELLLQVQAGEAPTPIGNRSPRMAPHGVFPCAGEDRWIAIAVHDDTAWHALAQAANLADERFAKVDGRRRFEDEIEARLAAWTAGFEADSLMRRLQRLGVAAGVVRSVREGLDDPHLVARGWFRDLTRPDLGRQKYNGAAWRFASAAMAFQSPPPRLGEHSELLFHDLLGLQPDDIARLTAKDVTGTVL